MKNYSSLLTQTVLTSVLALVSLVVFVVLIAEIYPPALQEEIGGPTGTASSAAPTESIVETPGTPEVPVPIQETIPVEEATEKLPKPAEEPQQSTQTPLEAISPVPFYSTPPIPLDIVNVTTLPAVVNILCGSTQGSAIPGATGSGIIIDPRGIILTNAHVAQYLLLKDHPSVSISCVIRSGAPAKARYTAELVTFPNKWAQKHAVDIAEELATGTGEHDWALLYITGTTDGSTKPETFPFVSYDAREGVATTNDQVLLASYPAGFLGSIALRKELWPVSTVVSIQKVYTFSRSIIDILALGGNIVAQGGSSGGAVINQWNKLVGIISTSSLGDTTAERDLRAVTLSHINKGVLEQTGNDLASFLQSGDFQSKVSVFKENSVPYLLELYPL